MILCNSNNMYIKTVGFFVKKKKNFLYESSQCESSCFVTPNVRHWQLKSPLCQFCKATNIQLSFHHYPISTLSDMQAFKGYALLERNFPYSATVTGLIAVLFEWWQIWGVCFKLRCVKEESLFDRRWCILGRSVIVMASDFCALNYGLDVDSENGGFYGYRIL